MKNRNNYYGMHLFKFDANTGTGGGATPPPATGTPGAGGEGTPPPPASANFYDTFKNQELKNFAITKGFKDPEMVVDSYLNFEKLKGVPQERLLTLPDKADAPEWKDVFKRLGTPEKPEDYKFETKPGADGKDAFGDWAKKAFHDANLTDAQAAKVVEAYRAMNTQTETATADQVKAQATKNLEELKSTWGNAYDQNLKIAQAAAQSFGASPEAVTAMENAVGHKATMEFFKNIGAKMGEGSFKQGEGKNQGFGKMDPVTAKANLDAKKQDSEFMAKVMKKSEAEFKIWTQLHQDAYPGEQLI